MTLKHYAFLIIILLGLHRSIYAQITPAPSATQTIVQDFGLGKISVSYSRPNTKGRKVFGDMEPYSVVWRTGANAATTIKFTHEVSIEGNKVPAGEYALFTIPEAKSWTIILSKNTKQWGAYTYKSSEDFLRFSVKPIYLNENIETFQIQFSNVFPTQTEMDLIWEHTFIPIQIKTEIDALVIGKIDSAMKTAKKPYYDAIIYYYNNKKDMVQALAWAKELEKEPGMPPMVSKLWKARVLLRLGKKAESISSAEEGLKDAVLEKSQEYERLNQELIKEAGK
jgi:Protein of unknown function (DUF2911)